MTTVSPVVHTPALGITARDHLLRGYSHHTTAPVPVITRGEGAYIWDDTGKRYLDAISAAFTVQIGHGRADVIAQAVAAAADLSYFPIMERAHPNAILLAERLAALAPPGLDKVFLSSGGAEAVESAWKIAKQYFKAIGQPLRHKVISIDLAYHGSTHGALTIGGLPGMHEMFGPLPDSGHTVPSNGSADAIAGAIEAEDPATVAAVIVEPLSRPSGLQPPIDFTHVRRACDEHGVLLIADEVICGVGRLGYPFGGVRYRLEPDIICAAKGLTSGYAPLGATIVANRITEPLLGTDMPLLHGYTFSGHPLTTAIALANLDVLEQEHTYDYVLATENDLRATLETLRVLPVVKAVHGTGFLYAIELQRAENQPFTPEERQRLITGWLATALFEAGLHCRAGDHGQPYIHIAPPLISGPTQFAEIRQILSSLLADLASGVPLH